MRLPHNSYIHYVSLHRKSITKLIPLSGNAAKGKTKIAQNDVFQYASPMCLHSFARQRKKISDTS